MSEITLVEPQKKDKTRCNVYVDGVFYCGIKLEVAVKYHLKSGMPVDKARLDEIQLETEKSQALDKAIAHLSATMKTERQIKDFLLKKGYTEAVCGYVLEKLKYHNLVDDYSYCRAYVQSVKGKGKRALYADLLKRGADKSAIGQALDEVEENDGEALAVLEKYMRGKQPTKENTLKGLKYLIARGFEYETAKSALIKFGGEDEDC